MKKRDKQFLNDCTSEFGSVAWSVKTEGYWCENGAAMESSLHISDCSSQITLDFDCEKKVHIKKRLDKLDSLISSLQKMRLAIVEAENEVNKPKYLY